MGQIQITTSLVMLALFSIAIIGFAINFANDTDAAMNIGSDSEMSNLLTNTQSGMESFKDQSSETYTSIVETTLEPGAQTAQSVGPFTVTPKNLFTVTENILRVGYKKIFGSDGGFAIFLYTFLGFLTLIFGLYAYKTLRGNPD